MKPQRYWPTGSGRSRNGVFEGLMMFSKRNAVTAEIQQLENIGTVTISAAQWGYLGEMDQSVITTADLVLGSLDVNGESRCNSLRIDQTPTAETPTPTHTFTISLDGTTYRIPCLV